MKLEHRIIVELMVSYITTKLFISETLLHDHGVSR